MESFSAKNEDLLIDYHAPSDTLYVRYKDESICYSDMIHDDLILNLNAEKAIVGVQVLGATSGFHASTRFELELFKPSRRIGDDHFRRACNLAKLVRSAILDLSGGRRKPYYMR